MKVLLVNTSDNTGGAAVACRRLMEALTLGGAEVRMLVRDQETKDPRVSHVRAPWQKAVERILMLPFTGFSWRRSWTIDVNWLGVDVSDCEAFRWADVIHIHWVNQGFLSIGSLQKIAHSGKRVVWTMHDLWPLDSIYHYEQSDRMPWLARHTMRRKLKAYGNCGVRFVTCSRWLMNQVTDSPLLAGNSITSIPNPIDTAIFHASDKKALRSRLSLPADGRIILFVSQKLTDERKGARFFIEAVNRLCAEPSDDGNPVTVVVLGSHGEDVASAIHTECRVLGYVTDQQRIADIYGAADVFVLPSLNDNLPNTIMEAMACGTPCVGFDIGGIPEMIDHLQTGYVARPKDVTDLTDGIRYVLSNSERLSEASVAKVSKVYNQAVVAQKYIEVYE
ncbi:MAG: glycosyltransferase [Bacteroidales bacterium]|nr:glycosyltransferase [Candidatus Liminaster caballi]